MKNIHSSVTHQSYLVYAGSQHPPDTIIIYHYNDNDPIASTASKKVNCFCTALAEFVKIDVPCSFSFCVQSSSYIKLTFPSIIMSQIKTCTTAHKSLTLSNVGLVLHINMASVAL